MTDKKRENLFAGLASLKAKETAAVAAVPEAAADAPPSPAPSRTVARPSQRQVEKKPAAVGKRNDPDYCQFNTYIPKTLRRAVEKALIDKDGVDHSSLVEGLLRKWLKSEGQSE